MRNSEKLYNTKDKLIQTTSDLCSFTYPTYEVENFDVIQAGLTVDSPNVFIIESPTDIPIELTFTEALDSLDSETKYNYTILHYNGESQIFDSTTGFISETFSYDGTIHSNTINTTDLIKEGEYLFKLSFQFDACTFIAGLLGKRYIANTFNSTLPYGNYDVNNDKYFIVLYRADEPRIDVGATNPDGSGEEGPTNTTATIINRPLAVEDGNGTYTLDLTSSEGSDIIITLNGSILQSGEGNDYVLEGNILKFSEPLVQSDVVNYILIGGASNSTFKSETIEINSFIVEGSKDGEGSNKAYFNTDSQKYEIYTNYRIKNKDSLIVTINGVVLSNGVDYYVSTSNTKRIILEGDLIVGDIINIVYDSGENLARTITQGFIDIDWYVVNEIHSNNGEFIIEFATDKLFLNVVQTETIPYETNVLNYTKRVTLNYSYGQVLFYRIRNVKTYTTLSGDDLVTENESDVIRIEIKTNISNNY
jgi:hypothetical protein